MAKKRETIFSKKLCQILTRQGAFVINYHGHLMQRSGLPDLQILLNNWKGFLELKCNKNKPTALQKKIAKRIQLRGTPVYIFRATNIDPEESFIVGVSSITKYQLETFDGRLVAYVAELESLIDILISLGTPKC